MIDQVHIVFRECQGVPSCEFVGVFFDRPSAEQFIKQRPDPSKFFIETYDKPEPGKQHEVFC
jgi:homospermidine synthase